MPMAQPMMKPFIFIPMQDLELIQSEEEKKAYIGNILYPYVEKMHEEYINI
jgi:hypothetical protein